MLIIFSIFVHTTSISVERERMNKMKVVLGWISRIASRLLFQYTNSKSRTSSKKEEAVDMAQFVQKIQGIQLPPHQLRELGLQEGWQKKVSPKYIEKVVNTAERFKKDLKELSKR